MEATARSKYSCPSCGAEATWNPAKKALVCGFCGTQSPATVELTGFSQKEEVIVEHDLVVALRNIPDSGRGWNAAKTQVKCQSCQAISVFDEKNVAQRCDFCGSSSLVPYEEVKASFRPESLLPLKISDTQVRDSIRAWYASRWFAPNALKKRALTDTVKGLYIPYWTFDAQVHARWTAMSGDYYYETERYTDSKGNRQTRQVRKVRWYPSAGSLEHFFDDELVAASRGVHPTLLRKVEPFPTKDLVPYDPSFLSGWVVERYQIDLPSAAHEARKRLEAKTVQLCAARVPGDTHRDLQVASTFSAQTFKHILAPLWLVTYDYHHTSFQCVVNGYTGVIAGEYPKSWIKITLAVLTVVVAVGLVLYFGNRR
jgi:DNA-directed RNA polymerase subunit RPC12/RpoP